MLYIVATPIGNLEDITLRALRILREVDFIICEDTRVTAKLLTHYDIKKSLISYHHHSKLDKINYIIEKLERGESAALVSDAGTPGISDPGGILVNEVLKRVEKSNGALNPPVSPFAKGGVKVVPIPGANAAITLASVSGIPMDKFLFLGFPPHKKGRKTFFENVIASEYPVIFYESCHRILKALKELRPTLFQRGDRGDFSKVGTVNIKNVGARKAYDKEKRAEALLNDNSQRAEKSPRPAKAGRPPLEKGVSVIVGRELTKMFETVYRGSVEDVIKELESNKNNFKGEFTVIVYRMNGH